MNDIKCAVCNKAIETQWNNQVGDCVGCNTCNSEFEVVWCSPLTLVESSEEGYEEYFEE